MASWINPSFSGKNYFVGCVAAWSSGMLYLFFSLSNPTLSCFSFSSPFAEVTR